MIWFVASIISVIKYKEGVQEEFPVFEDFYLFKADSKAELDEKIAQEMTLIDAAGECEYDGHPARQVCVGVRKVRSVYNEPPLDIDSDPPSDRTELTHSFFIASSFETVQDLATGKRVQIEYVDDAE